MIRRFVVEYRYKAEGDELVGWGRALTWERIGEDVVVEQIGHAEDMVHKFSWIMRHYHGSGVYVNQKFRNGVIVMELTVRSECADEEKAEAALEMLSPKLAQEFRYYMQDQVKF